MIMLFTVTVISSGCKSEDVVPILNPPMGLRVLNNSDKVALGDLPNPDFTLDTVTNKPRILQYFSATKFIDGVVDNSTHCIAIEFYGYNTETGFNGYNIYAMGGHIYGDEAEAWQDFVANLTLYQSAHSGPSPANPFFPVAPGTISSPYYASIASSSVSFSGGLTKIVVVFNRYQIYGTYNPFPPNFGAGTYYIGVTAVSITEGSIYESLPSNIIKIIIT